MEGEEKEIMHVRYAGTEVEGQEEDGETDGDLFEGSFRRCAYGPPLRCAWSGMCRLMDCADAGMKDGGGSFCGMDGGMEL